MSKQQNFFIDKGMTFETDINISDTDGPVDLTGHVFRFNTPTEVTLGVAVGNNVAFEAAVDETTKYVIDHTYPDGTYEWVFYGEVKVREWL